MANNTNAEGKKIRLAVAGIGNCCSSLVQGITYYKYIGKDDEPVPGLMHNVIGDYAPRDIQIWRRLTLTGAKWARMFPRLFLKNPTAPKFFAKTSLKPG